MIRWLARRLADLAGAAPKMPATHMAAEDALNVARAALAEHGARADRPLAVRAVLTGGEEIVWVIATATRGSGASVRIRDRDGAVMDLRRAHSR